MKSLSLKVMTLLMAALVLSASGCFNENEMSSPEGTVKGFLKATNKEWYRNVKKMLSYFDPRIVTKDVRRNHSRLFRAWRKAERKSGIKLDITDVKTTLVSKKENLVWKDDKWHRVKNENTTVEISYKLNGENFQQTEELVLLDNKWYIANKDNWRYAVY